MKVVCIDNEDENDTLTIDKVYDVTDSKVYSNMYVITNNDMDQLAYYYKYRFEPVKNNLYIFNLYEGNDIYPETFLCLSPTLDDALKVFIGNSNAVTTTPEFNYLSYTGRLYSFIYTETYKDHTNVSTWHVTEIVDIKPDYLYS